MNVFSLTDFKLNGANLIEASAGTGKTYTISALFLRLILEKGVSVGEILVVTFTRAATAELKQRLRNALVAAQRYIQTNTCLDATLRLLFEKALSMHGEALFAARVNTALRAFDEAAIFTIHSFCQRAIKNNALLANSAFEMELSANANEIYEAVIYDFWRQHVLKDEALAKALQALKMLPDSGEQVSYARAKNVWKEALQQALRNQGTPVEWPPFGEPLTEEDIDRIQEIFDGSAMKDYLAKLEMLQVQQGFNARNIGSKPQCFVEAKAAWLDAKPGVPLRDEADRLTFPTDVKFVLKKNHVMPTAPDECYELKQLYQRASESYLAKATEALRRFYKEAPKLYRQKQKVLGITTFDDMLFTLYDALHAPSGKELAGALCGQYKAALIDEFQDTDAIQYGIFRQIFMKAHSDDSFVCFVGDPKQSIYRFRGADIQTYLTAREDIGEQNRFTLKENYRSTEALIKTVNGLFASDTSFGADRKIAYQSVLSGKRDKRGLMRGDEELKALAVVTAQGEVTDEGAYEHVAKTIVKYLRDESLTIDGARVEAKDIAILVRWQAEIRQMQRHLQRYGVQSRVVCKDRIYDSDDAKEIEAIFRAALNPRDLKSVKTALATRIIGCDALTVYRIGVDEVQASDDRQTYGYWLTRFYAYRDAWETRGAGYLLSRLIQEHQTVKRFLSETDGPRRLTNLYHLLELLYDMSVEYRLPEALMENFGKMRQTVIDLEDESPESVRMESDDNIVTIMTYHKSKGLEFPIVLLPCAFKLTTSQRADKFNVFEEYENAEGKKRISVALVKAKGKSTPCHSDVEPLQAQYLAEQLRLFYVAVTRASRRLEIVDTSQDGVLTQYLINHDWNRFVESGWAEPIEMSPNGVCKPLDDRPDTVSVDSLANLPMPSRDHAWMMTSYSQMINRVDRENDHHDEFITPIKNADVVQALFDLGVDQDDLLFFPRGAEAGEALHQIMEKIDFVDCSEHEVQIAKAIERYFPNDAKASHYQAQAKRMVDALLNIDLGNGWKLKDIDRSARVSEMEFLLSMRSADVGSRLIERIRRESRPGYRFAMADGGYDHDRLKGYLKGFMDLVVEVEGRYYILDWKSNFLVVGMPALADEVLNDFLLKNYSSSSMEQSVQSHGYALQYLLYTVALHRMLKVRLGAKYDYEKHFGGVFYLFVRGVRPGLAVDGKPCGVWYDCPSRALIEDLDAILGSSLDD